eukprot:2965960-Pleurochrysis_carterae.AAC.1
MGLSFVESVGGHLSAGREPWRFVGANVYWLMLKAQEGTQGRAKVTSLLDVASGLGLTVIRMWAFGEGSFNSLWPGPDQPNERSLQQPIDIHAIGLSNTKQAAASSCRFLRILTHAPNRRTYWWKLSRVQHAFP